MKKLLPLIFVTLLLAGCTSQGSTKMTDDQLFQKKQECAGYKDEMLKDSININQKRMNISGDPYNLEVEEIFYSGKYKSCLYVLGISKIVDIDSSREMLLNKYVYDFFSKKEILSTEDMDSEKNAMKIKDFEKDVDAVR